MIPSKPIDHPAAWHGADMARSEEWIETLGPDEIAEVKAAMRCVKERGLLLHAVRRADFPLPTLSTRLARIAREVEDGRGFVLLRGLPVEQYPDEEIRYNVWGVGAHLGIPVSQSKNGELLGEVRDLGVRFGTPTSRGYRSNEHLRSHTDLSDVVLLLCVRKAKTGALSPAVSSVAVHNEIMRRRPDLLRVLYADYHHSRQGEEAPGEGPWYAKPVFGVCDGRFLSQYSRSFVESTQPGFAGAVEHVTYLGGFLQLRVQLASGEMLTAVLQNGDGATAIVPGAPVHLGFERCDVVVLSGE